MCPVSSSASRKWLHHNLANGKRLCKLTWRKPLNVSTPSNSRALRSFVPRGTSEMALSIESMTAADSSLAHATGEATPGMVVSQFNTQPL